MRINSNPLRLLLKLNPATHSRLGKATLPFGYTRTKWINEAICEKLDREQPETSVHHGELSAAGERVPIDPHAILAELKRKEVRKNVSAIGPYSIYYKGTSTYQTGLMNHRSKAKKGTSLGIEGEIEALALQSPEYLLSAEQKRAIMAEHGEMQAQARKAAEADPDAIPDDVRGHFRKYAEWREKRDAEKTGVALPEVSETGELSDTAEYLALVNPAPAPVDTEDEDPDFWGDKFLVMKAKAGK